MAWTDAERLGAVGLILMCLLMMGSSGGGKVVASVPESDTLNDDASKLIASRDTDISEGAEAAANGDELPQSTKNALNSGQKGAQAILERLDDALKRDIARAGKVLEQEQAVEEHQRLTRVREETFDMLDRFITEIDQIFRDAQDNRTEIEAHVSLAMQEQQSQAIIGIRNQINSVSLQKQTNYYQKNELHQHRHYRQQNLNLISGGFGGGGGPGGGGPGGGMDDDLDDDHDPKDRMDSDDDLFGVKKIKPRFGMNLPPTNFGSSMQAAGSDSVQMHRPFMNSGASSMPSSTALTLGRANSQSQMGMVGRSGTNDNLNNPASMPDLTNDPGGPPASFSSAPAPLAINTAPAQQYDDPRTAAPPQTNDPAFDTRPAANDDDRRAAWNSAPRPPPRANSTRDLRSDNPRAFLAAKVQKVLRAALDTEDKAKVDRLVRTMAEMRDSEGQQMLPLYTQNYRSTPGTEYTIWKTAYERILSRKAVLTSGKVKRSSGAKSTTVAARTVAQAVSRGDLGIPAERAGKGKKRRVEDPTGASGGFVPMPSAIDNTLQARFAGVTPEEMTAVRATGQAFSQAFADPTKTLQDAKKLLQAQGSAFSVPTGFGASTTTTDARAWAQGDDDDDDPMGGR